MCICNFICISAKSPSSCIHYSHLSVNRMSPKMSSTTCIILNAERFLYHKLGSFDTMHGKFRVILESKVCGDFYSFLFSINLW